MDMILGGYEANDLMIESDIAQRVFENNFKTTSKLSESNLICSSLYNSQEVI